MPGQEFMRWCDIVGVRFAADIVDRLGVHRNTAQTWLAQARNGDDVPIKPPIAYAMSAIAAGLKPWGQNDD